MNSLDQMLIQIPGHEVQVSRLGYPVLPFSWVNRSEKGEVLMKERVDIHRRSGNQHCLCQQNTLRRIHALYWRIIRRTRSDSGMGRKAFKWPVQHGRYASPLESWPHAVLKQYKLNFLFVNKSKMAYYTEWRYHSALNCVTPICDWWQNACWDCLLSSSECQEGTLQKLWGDFGYISAISWLSSTHSERDFPPLCLYRRRLSFCLTLSRHDGNGRNALQACLTDLSFRRLDIFGGHDAYQVPCSVWPPMSTRDASVIVMSGLGSMKGIPMHTCSGFVHQVSEALTLERDSHDGFHAVSVVYTICNQACR